MTPDHKMPPISILIPAYNLAEYIGDAILCAVQQDYPGRIQIIVLDDGSSDQTLERIRQAASGYPQVIIQTQQNTGRAGARNRLLDLADTELVAWLDGDDMAPPCWISQQVAKLTSQPELVAVSGWGYAMTAKGLPIGPIERPLSHREIDELHINGNSSGFFQSCTITKKSVVKAVGGYRSEFSASEDYDLWLRLAEVGELQNHSNTHLYYRVHATSANATLSHLQRQQGLTAVNEARLKRGLPPLDSCSWQDESSSRESEWKRQVYWINIAMKAGNPWTAWKLAACAIVRNPASLLIWLMLLVSSCDVLLQFGNRTGRFRPGQENRIRRLGSISAYRLARRLLLWKRRIQKRVSPRAS